MNFWNFCKKRKKQIIISLLISLLASYIMGLTRAYTCFGGEDLLIIAVPLYYVFLYLFERERDS